MATQASKYIVMLVQDSVPAAAPTAIFSDQGADRIELVYQAVGGDVSLTGPAELWAWMTDTNRWRRLEAGFPLTRTVADGTEHGDQIARSVPNIGAITVVYPTIVDGGTAVYEQRTIREIAS